MNSSNKSAEDQGKICTMPGCEELAFVQGENWEKSFKFCKKHLDGFASYLHMKEDQDRVGNEGIF